ncbi:hypothetical protein CXB51_006223 [Gossypium anomalum]|uniref:Bet v I/Major latex protein domain-containing protein n=1 Tax=Gossypium anomalum TaxID=47600 RepID=A0A8J5YZE5_9ROSI|nr:hypothetical protein CXB51_006223 [Gossypium anomalum]
MGGFAKEVKVSTSLPPTKAFKAFAEDLDTLFVVACISSGNAAAATSSYFIRKTYVHEFLLGCMSCMEGHSLTLFPTVAPQAIKSVERLEGDGGPGTIKKITFTEGYGFSYAKHRVDVLDKDNLLYTYVVIESDFFNNMVEKISYETKFVAAADGGTSIKVTTTQGFKLRSRPRFRLRCVCRGCGHNECYCGHCGGFGGSGFGRCRYRYITAAIADPKLYNNSGRNLWRNTHNGVFMWKFKEELDQLRRTVPSVLRTMKVNIMYAIGHFSLLVFSFEFGDSYELQIANKESVVYSDYREA